MPTTPDPIETVVTIPGEKFAALGDALAATLETYEREHGVSSDQVLAGCLLYFGAVLHQAGAIPGPDGKWQALEQGYAMSADAAAQLMEQSNVVPLAPRPH